MYNDYGYTASSSATDTVLGIFAGLGIFMLLMVVACVLGIIGLWKIFKKAGKPGWVALIPGANMYELLKIVGINQKWLLLITYGAVIVVIPILGYIAWLVAIIYYYTLFTLSLSHSFGKTGGFSVGLWLLAPIFYFVLGINSDKYLGPKPINDIVFGKSNDQSPVNNTQVSATNVSTNTTAKFCTACGSQVDASTKFCTSCGSEIK